MILFINPISENIRLHVVEGVELRHTSTIPKWKDYDEFPEMLNDLLNRHNIDNIWCVIWPGAFTRMRIVTLALNTFAMVKNIPLKGGHFFDIIDHPNPILYANDREYILLGDNGPFLCEKESLNQQIQYVWYAKKNDFTDEKNFIEYREDFVYIAQIFGALPNTQRLSPVYLKEAHITWSKKKTFPSSKTTNKS